MSKRLTFLYAILLIQPLTICGQDDIPTLLQIPEDWRFEKIDFPLDFAPDINYKGFEELRFAPGMFDTSSSTYFTYIFALSVDNKKVFDKREIKKFLIKYYRGLCSAVAESKEFKPDVSKINVKLEKKAVEEIQTFSARVNFFDSFTNGQEIILNMELEVFKSKANKRFYVLALVSPQKRESKVWENLHEIKEKLKEKSSFFKI